MEIVYTEKVRTALLEYLEGTKQVSGTIDIVGSVHEGHFKLLEECKKKCDILVVEYSKFWGEAAVYYKENKYIPTEYAYSEEDNVDKSKTTFSQEMLKVDKIVDFVVYSPMNRRRWEETLFFEKYKEEFIKVHNDIGLPSVFHLSAAYPIHSEVVESCTKTFAGCKNLVMGAVMRKIIPKEYLIYNPETIWFLYRDPKTFHVVSRTSGSPTLGKMAKEAFDRLLEGKRDFKTFEDISNEWFLEERYFSIVDWKTAEKLSCVNDNCVIVFADDTKCDYVILKDGELIF